MGDAHLEGGMHKNAIPPDHKRSATNTKRGFEGGPSLATATGSVLGP